MRRSTDIMVVCTQEVGCHLHTRYVLFLCERASSADHNVAGPFISNPNIQRSFDRSIHLSLAGVVDKWLSFSGSAGGCAVSGLHARWEQWPVQQLRLACILYIWTTYIGIVSVSSYLLPSHLRATGRGSSYWTEFPACRAARRARTLAHIQRFLIQFPLISMTGPWTLDTTRTLQGHYGDFTRLLATHPRSCSIIGPTYILDVYNRCWAMHCRCRYRH